MARILITGGTGRLGTELTPRLLETGWTVRILSRRPRPPATSLEIEWAVGDGGTGAGLSAALQDVDTVIHAASHPTKAHLADTAAAQRIIDLSGEHPIAHLLYISIVGIDDFPYPYYQAKLATERIIEKGPVPWTILRATQFHNFLGDLVLPTLDRAPLFFVPTDFPFQLIDEGEVASRMVELVVAGPSGRVADIGGPEILAFGEIARSWLKMQGRRRRIFHLPVPGKAATAFRAGRHTLPENCYGKITWQQWLDRRAVESRNGRSYETHIARRR